jgi:hypothetical protein
MTGVLIPPPHPARNTTRATARKVLVLDHFLEFMDFPFAVLDAPVKPHAITEVLVLGIPYKPRK